jgi:hypothetical protein
MFIFCISDHYIGLSRYGLPQSYIAQYTFVNCPAVGCPGVYLQLDRIIIAVNMLFRKIKEGQCQGIDSNSVVLNASFVAVHF